MMVQIQVVAPREAHTQNHSFTTVQFTTLAPLDSTTNAPPVPLQSCSLSSGSVNDSESSAPDIRVSLHVVAQDDTDCCRQDKT